MPSAHPRIYRPVLGNVLAELIANCIIAFLAIIVVGLRILGRRLGPGLGWDDLLVVITTPMLVLMVACQGLLARIGGGYPMAENLELIANFPFISKVVFAMSLLYVTILAVIKASMLCFFMRVFVTTFIQRGSIIFMVVLAAWAVGFCMGFVFLCDPVSAQWTREGKCGDNVPLVQALISSNIISDLVIMIMPMYNVWKLQTRTSEKLGIIASFSLGFAVVICAAFRLVYISDPELRLDVTGTLPTIIFLFVLEPNLAILCASIPMLRPLYSMYKKRSGNSRLDEVSDEHTGGYSIPTTRSKRVASPDATVVDREHGGDDGPLGLGWEMHDFYRPGMAKHDITHDATVATSPGDESGSEKNLTHSEPSRRTKGAIRVETVWTMTRS